MKDLLEDELGKITSRQKFENLTIQALEQPVFQKGRLIDSTLQMIAQEHTVFGVSETTSGQYFMPASNAESKGAKKTILKSEDPLDSVPLPYL
jgi:hypothetical protein